MEELVLYSKPALKSISGPLVPLWSSDYLTVYETMDGCLFIRGVGVIKGVSYHGTEMDLEGFVGQRSDDNRTDLVWDRILKTAVLMGNGQLLAQLIYTNGKEASRRKTLGDLRLAMKAIEQAA